MPEGQPSAAKRASLYTALHTGTPGDREYYVRQCRGVASILELGCGSGRILRALEPGALRVGLDIDIELLRLARRDTNGDHARVHWVRADMCEARFDHRFERILLPYTGLYCLANDDEVRRLFERVRDHLADGGRFVFDAYCADGLHEGGANPEHAHDAEAADDGDVGEIEVAGTTYHVYEESEWTPERQQLDVVYVYEPRSGGHSIADRIRHHYLRLAQIEPLLRSAGLELVSLEGDFSGAPAPPRADHFVAVACRSGTV